MTKISWPLGIPSVVLKNRGILWEKCIHKIFLAGPMSGESSFAELHRVANIFRMAGLDVVNATNADEGYASHPWQYYLERDIPELFKCNAVAVLKRWNESRVAVMEAYIAFHLGIPVLDAYTLSTIERREILDGAIDMILREYDCIGGKEVG